MNANINNAEKLLSELDVALESINEPDCDMLQVANTVSRACRFLVSTLDLAEKQAEELREERDDCQRIIEALVEQNNTLQVDLQIILEFLKENKIDISYAVKKTPKQQKPNK